MQATSYGAAYRTKLFVSRLKANDKPVIKMPATEIPADKGKRHFETVQTKNGERVYEIFSGITGTVESVYKSNRAIEGKDECFLVLEIESGGTSVNLEVGNFDSQYSRNVMARLLNPNFNLAAPASFSPYDSTKDGKRHIGIAVYQGDDIVPSLYYDDLKRMGCPEREMFYNPREKKEVAYYMPVVDWLYERIKEKWASVDPISAPSAAPIQTKVTASPAANTLTSSNVPQMLEARDAKGLKDPVPEPGVDDDLPF